MLFRSPAAFLDALAPILPDGLEPDALHDAPRAFPVALQLAHRLSRGRTVLVGESLMLLAALRLCRQDSSVVVCLPAEADGQLQALVAAAAAQHPGHVRVV